MFRYWIKGEISRVVNSDGVKTYTIPNNDKEYDAAQKMLENLPDEYNGYSYIEVSTHEAPFGIVQMVVDETFDFETYTKSEEEEDPEDLIKSVDSLLEKIGNSDSTYIQQDLVDTPSEPLAFDILGSWYIYESAEVVDCPTRDGLETDQEIMLTLLREKDAEVFSSKKYQLPMSVEDFEEWKDNLKKYLEEHGE